MTSDLKRLALELHQLFEERGGLLDAPAREAFERRIEILIRDIDDAEAAQEARLQVEALDLFAALLSVITNVMTLLK
jgi:hypothetical protein